MKPWGLIPRYAANVEGHEDHMLYCSEQIYVICHDKKKIYIYTFNHLKSTWFEIKEYSKPYNAFL